MFKLKQTIVVELSNEVYHIVNTFLLYHFPCRLQQSHHFFLYIQDSFYALKWNNSILQKKDKFFHSNSLTKKREHTSECRP